MHNAIDDVAYRDDIPAHSPMHDGDVVRWPPNILDTSITPVGYC